MQWLINKLAARAKTWASQSPLRKPMWVSRTSAKPLNFNLGDHTFDVVDEFTSVSPSPRTWALTQKSPEESAKPPAPSPIWLRKPGITNTWLGTPKCTTTTHAFSAVWRLAWWHPYCKTRRKKIFIVNVPKICLKLRLLFDVDFHGESERADESWIFVSMIRLFCSVIRVSVCLHYSERVRQCGRRVRDYPFQIDCVLRPAPLRKNRRRLVSDG